MSLLPDLVRNAHAVLANGDEPAPAAVNMAEVLRQLEVDAVKLPADALEAFDLLRNNSHEPLRATIAASRLEHPTATRVLDALRQLESARNESDIAYDVRQVSLLAERLLGSPEALANPNITAFAIEVQADHALPIPGDADARQDWAPATVDAPGTSAAGLSELMEVPIVLMGVDATGLLTRCIATEGQLMSPVRESRDVFSEHRLRQWSQEFPFRYGVDETTVNLFYTSTEGLGVGGLPARAILVNGANIQHWPPNLIRIGEEFAGQTRRLAAAPSLAWLKAARLRRITDRRALAWIPKESSDAGGYTLQSVVDRVSDLLATHGVSLDTTSAIPPNLEGAELVIVTAHGGLVPGNRYFQVVKDDANLAMAGSDLGSALKNVGVAVLFVCSGGRLDPHPMAIRTVGLARQVLGNGCTTVVASPWPIDSRIPSYWLPTFLEAWDAGRPVIDAAFEANTRVRDNFSSEFRDCLAMSVYGDPLRTKVR
jgi:CHAT domain